jgi:hypothetical protein
MACNPAIVAVDERSLPVKAAPAAGIFPSFSTWGEGATRTAHLAVSAHLFASSSHDPTPRRRGTKRPQPLPKRGIFGGRLGSRLNDDCETASGLYTRHGRGMRQIPITHGQIEYGSQRISHDLLRFPPPGPRRPPVAAGLRPSLCDGVPQSPPQDSVT